MANAGSVTYTLGIKDSASPVLAKVGQGAENLRGRISRIGGSATSLISGPLAQIGTALTGAFAVQKLFSVNAEFQKFNAVLTNTLGSASAAAEGMQMVRDLAAETPFSVAELTGSFVKLVNRGFTPTRDELIALGDIASATGKGIDQLTEALLDAQTGEMERLKEFGITAKQQGDKIAFTFKGQTTVVQKNDKAIQQYVIGLGKLKGVAGSSAVQMDTLGGKFSNLGDKFDAFLLKLGEGGANSFMASVIDGLGDALTFASDAFDVLNANGFAFSNILAPLQPIFDEFRELGNNLFGGATAMSTMQAAADGLAVALDVLEPLLNGIGTAIKVINENAEGLKKIFKGIGFLIAGTLKGVSTVLGSVIEGLSNSLGGISKIIEGVFTGNFSLAKEGVKQGLKGSMKLGAFALGPGALLAMENPTLNPKFQTLVDPKAAKKDEPAKAKDPIDEINSLVEKWEEERRKEEQRRKEEERRKLAKSASGQALSNTISGQRPQTININIPKALVESITVQTQTLRESIPQVKAIVEKAMVELLTTAESYARAT